MTRPVTRSTNPLDVLAVRADFPVLHQTIGDKPLVYLDNAATTQKPQSVIDTITSYYTRDNANIHRGVHELSMRATRNYEAVRDNIRGFIGAHDASEIVFVRGTTEAVNLVAQSFARPRLQSGDEVIISAMEHHSNIVPWQMVCDQTGASLRVAPMLQNGDLDVDGYRNLFTNRTRMVAIAHVSNALGTVNPVKDLIAIAHQHNVPVLLDSAQALAHVPIDVAELDCDFLAASAHKAYGPTGAGFLYAKREHLDAMDPYQGGGDMIASVTFDKTTYNEVPHKFEAGTPNISGVIGMGAAIDYLAALGWNAVTQHEDAVVDYATESLSDLSGVTLVGRPAQRAGVVSFLIDGVHPHDAGTILDRDGIAIRAGHHCSQPVMEFYKIPATNRASFGVYNTRDDVDALLAGVRHVQEVFA